MTPKIPITLKLKKKRHKDIAKAQDLLIKELYKVYDKAVLHGGTSIWRCFSGNRFSEDIDVYLPNKKNVDLLFQKFQNTGFEIEKKRVKKRSLFSKLKLSRIMIRFEAVFKKVDSELVNYETADANLITIYSLLPEDLIKEKINAYLKRRKIRDLYDVFFLLRYVDKKDVKNSINKLIKNFKKPKNEKNLKTLIIEGLVPDSKKMLNYIKRRR